MRTQNAKPAIELVSALLLGVAVFACGVEKKPKYDDDKATDQLGEATPQSQTPSANGDPQPGDGPGADVPGAEDPDPSTLVLHNSYRAAFDRSSARALVRGRSPNANLGLAKSQVEKKLSAAASTDGVIVQQTVGDGVRYSDGTQIITNAVGDLDVDLAKGEVSASGEQRYRRVTGDAGCPNVFVCIDHMTFQPKTGSPTTYCYSKGDQPAAIPFAAASNYRADDFKPHLKAYGPYKVKRYAGLLADCEKAVEGKQPELEESVMITVSRPSPTTTMRFRKADAVPVEHVVELLHERVTADDVAPYLDETVRLQHRTRFYMNETKRQLVKMVKTTRQKVDLPSIVGIFFKMDGLEIDVGFELCKDLLQATPAEFCSP
jgi:hypothetical protein